MFNGSREAAPAALMDGKRLKSLVHICQNAGCRIHLRVLVSGTSSRNVTTFSDSKPNGIAMTLLAARV